MMATPAHHTPHDRTNRWGSRRIRRRFPLQVTFAACLISGWWAGPARSLAESSTLTEAITSARESITVDELNGHVELLADDALEGREAGTRGGYAAGNYLARTFQESLQPAGEGNSFFQAFGNGYRNLVGVIPGSDPQLQHEYVLIGAHYDHVGYGTPRNSQGPIGHIHNGADDNASGTSALLEIIQAFQQSSLKPRRSIIFAFWDGEEKGLLGSRYWVDHPTVPLQQVQLAINIDMIGRLRNRQLEVLGSHTMSGLRGLVAQANQQSDLELIFPWKIEENSDHYSFFARQIPYLMFHTGLHDDYHRPSDDSDKVNVEGMQDTTRLVLSTLWSLANREEMSDFRLAAAHETETLQRQYEQSAEPLPPRLGIRWEVRQEAAQTTLEVLSVAPGSDAAVADLRVGDIITDVQNAPVLASSTLQQAAVSARVLLLHVRRNGDTEPREIRITFRTPPTRLGISWREHPAEPQTITIVRVVPHSIAHQAGLEVGDRVQALDGETFRDGRQFADRARDVQLPSTILIERHGKLIERTLPSLPEEPAIETVPVTTPTSGSSGEAAIDAIN